MFNAVSTAIIMVLAIPLVAIMGGMIVAIIKLLKSDGSARSRRLNEEETRIMQEIYRGLEKMEKRVETLETLLLEREGRDKHERPI